MMCNWIRIAGQDWLERLIGWFEGSGCDVWIVHGIRGPGDYAENWLVRQAELSTTDQFAEGFDRWMAYYERHGIEAIDFGLITLRRRTAGQNWIRVDVDRDPDHPNGTGIAGGLRCTRPVGPDRGRAVMARVAASPVSPSCGSRSGSSPPNRAGRSTGPIASLTTACDSRGSRPGRLPSAHALPRTTSSFRILPQVAARLGRDPEEFLADCLEAARSLIKQGFLLPVEVPLETDGGRPSPAARDGDDHGPDDFIKRVAAGRASFRRRRALGGISSRAISLAPDQPPQRPADRAGSSRSRSRPAQTCKRPSRPASTFAAPHLFRVMLPESPDDQRSIYRAPTCMRPIWPRPSWPGSASGGPSDRGRSCARPISASEPSGCEPVPGRPPRSRPPRGQPDRGQLRDTDLRGARIEGARMSEPSCGPGGCTGAPEDDLLSLMAGGLARGPHFRTLL